MITDGVKETDEGTYRFSQSAAKALIAELQRAVEEAQDHQIIFTVDIRTVRYDISAVIGKLLLEIQPK